MFNLFFGLKLDDLHMNMATLVKHDYFRPISPNDPKKDAFLTKSEKIKLNINDQGRLQVKGKRYLRLGKISLYDPVSSRPISPSEFVGILDTMTGEVQCFDINKVYEEYIQDGTEHINTGAGSTYRISEQTKEIVMSTIMERNKSNIDNVREPDYSSSSNECVDFV